MITPIDNVHFDIVSIFQIYQLIIEFDFILFKVYLFCVMASGLHVLKKSPEFYCSF